MKSRSNNEPPEEEDDDKDSAAYIADEGRRDVREDISAEKGACADAEIEDSGVYGCGYGRTFRWGDTQNLGLKGYVEVGRRNAPESTDSEDDDRESAEWR